MHGVQAVPFLNHSKTNIRILIGSGIAARASIDRQHRSVNSKSVDELIRGAGIDVVILDAFGIAG